MKTIVLNSFWASFPDIADVPLPDAAIRFKLTFCSLLDETSATVLTEPNLVVGRVPMVTDEQIAAIEADPLYGPDAILHVEDLGLTAKQAALPLAQKKGIAEAKSRTRWEALEAEKAPIALEVKARFEETLKKRKVMESDLPAIIDDKKTLPGNVRKLNEWMITP